MTNLAQVVRKLLLATQGLDATMENPDFVVRLTPRKPETDRSQCRALARSVLKSRAQPKIAWTLSRRSCSSHARTRQRDGTTEPLRSRPHGENAHRGS